MHPVYVFSLDRGSNIVPLTPLYGCLGFLSFFFNQFTDGRTPWTSDQPVARPLPKHRTTQTQKNAYTPNIHALSEFRTHDHGFRASEDSACLRPLGYRDRLIIFDTRTKQQVKLYLCIFQYLHFWVRAGTTAVFLN
jgi:hypothetical protein